MVNNLFKLAIKLIFLICFFFFAGCNSETKKSSQTSKSKEPSELPQNNLTFEAVNGVRFYEVKRRFKTGLSFNADGFQQEPSWTIEFKAPDSMLAYSPEIKRMQGFYLQHDHDKVYNFAREFFRANIISKDSMVLQRLQVDGRIIAGNDDLRSDVNCTFYTKDYIENKLHTTVDELRKPTKADTLFIKKLSERTYRDPENASVAFAAREPVVFTPKGKFITVKKLSNINEASQRTAAYDYIYPEYKIVILRAYKDFAYNMRVVVDANGKIYVKTVNYVLNPEGRKKMLQGVVDIYLKNMLMVSPGKTLGIPHSSEVTVNIVGKLAK
ncbi:MAG: hypothetical protein V4541_05645 [Bacteroidota bacterium]